MITRFRNKERIAIVEGYTQLTMAESDNFRTEVVNALDSGCGILLVNLSDVDFLDSSGLGAVMEARRLAGTKGSKFGVFGIGGRIKDIFKMTGLNQVLDIFENEGEAIKGLGSGSR